jgi:multidrug efflux system outer membrane protein
VPVITLTGSTVPIFDELVGQTLGSADIEIRAVEQIAHAQMAQVGLAQALRFPTFTLTGSLGVESDANFWSIGGHLFGLLFAFGKNKRRVEVERARYDGGVTSYIEVLDIERSLFNAELLASAALQQRYAALVQLYKALGGGWQ